MKKSFLLLAAAFTLVSGASFAEETITLNPVTTTQIERCTPVTGADRAVEIASIMHKGADESVGVIMKKDIPTKVFVANDLKQVISDSVRNTLTKCGYKLAKGAESLKLHVIIDDFFTKSKNEGVVGKDKATMSLKINIKVPGQNQDYTVIYGAEKEVKAPPFAKAKRFQKLLGAILVDVMNQVAMSETLSKQVAALSKPITNVQVSGTHNPVVDESTVDE